MVSRDVVAITGAAGGIGSVAVATFAAAGYAVLGIDIVESVETLGEQLGCTDVVGVAADHRDLQAVQDALTVALTIGSLRHVVLLAGIALAEETRLGGGRELPHPDVFRQSVELNLLGHVNVVWAAQQQLFTVDGDRSVTLCSSVNAMQGWGEPAYSTAKAGMLGLVYSLAGPYGTRGVRINAVAPGTIDTPNTRAEYAHDPTHFAEMERGVPLGRLGQPADVAATLLALARDLTHVTGQVLCVDGGQTVWR